MNVSNSLRGYAGPSIQSAPKAEAAGKESAPVEGAERAAGGAQEAGPAFKVQLSKQVTSGEH